MDKNSLYKVYGLVQHCSISIALAMEILQSCTEPSKCHFHPKDNNYEVTVPQPLHNQSMHLGTDLSSAGQSIMLPVTFWGPWGSAYPPSTPAGLYGQAGGTVKRLALSVISFLSRHGNNLYKLYKHRHRPMHKHYWTQMKAFLGVWILCLESCWRRDTETISSWLVLCEENTPNRMSIIRCFDVFFGISLPTLMTGLNPAKMGLICVDHQFWLFRLTRG